MPVTGLLVALLAASPLPQPTLKISSAAFSIPFELSDGHIFVSAYVNGRGPYRFGFDTGASGVGRADNRLVEALKLPPAGTASVSDSIKATTVARVAIKSLRIGSLEWRDVDIPARDYNPNVKSGGVPMYGIIAREFFADQLVTIDYPSRTIRFERGSLRSGGKGVVAYEGGLVIPVCFVAGCVEGRIDTGSSRGIVIPKDLVGRIAASGPVPIGQGLRTNGVANLYEMTLKEPVRIGDIAAVGEKVLYADPSDDKVVVGTKFLEDYVLTIDQRNKLLRIEMPGGR
jgi:hypothetical protein